MLQSTENLPKLTLLGPSLVFAIWETPAAQVFLLINSVSSLQRELDLISCKAVTAPELEGSLPADEMGSDLGWGAFICFQSDLVGGSHTANIKDLSECE